MDSRAAGDTGVVYAELLRDTSNFILTFFNHVLTKLVANLPNACKLRWQCKIVAGGEILAVRTAHMRSPQEVGMADAGWGTFLRFHAGRKIGISVCSVHYSATTQDSAKC
jgi:hypothetical protein